MSDIKRPKTWHLDPGFEIRLEEPCILCRNPSVTGIPGTTGTVHPACLETRTQEPPIGGSRNQNPEP